MSLVVAEIRSRAIALSVALLVLVAAPLAAAQDPRSSEVQNAAREWLKLVDQGDYRASWKAAGKKFQQTFTEAGWAAAAGKLRAPFGPAEARTVALTHFDTRFPNLPDGDYALVQFRTSFKGKDYSGETVNLEHEDTGWRVIGYFIR